MWSYLGYHLQTDVHKFYSMYFDREPKVVLERIKDVKEYLRDYDERLEACRHTLDAIVDVIDDNVDDIYDVDIDTCSNLFERYKSLNTSTMAVISSEENNHEDEHHERGDSMRIDASYENSDAYFSCDSPFNIDSDMCCEAENEEEQPRAETRHSRHEINAADAGDGLETEYEDSTSAPKGGELSCDKCGQRFASRSNLYRHKRKIACQR